MKKNTIRSIFLGLLFALTLVANAVANPSAGSVCRVRVEDRDGRSISWGSGCLVAWGDKAYVVTNDHVVADRAHNGSIMCYWPAANIRRQGYVIFSQRRQDRADIAVLAVSGNDYPVPAVPVADQNYRDGSVFGFGPKGHFAEARVQIWPQAGNYYAYMSSPVRQGDSGGPVFTERGHLSGVVWGATDSTSVANRVETVKWALTATETRLRNLFLPRQFGCYPCRPGQGGQSTCGPCNPGRGGGSVTWGGGMRPRPQPQPNWSSPQQPAQPAQPQQPAPGAVAGGPQLTVPPAGSGTRNEPPKKLTPIERTPHNHSEIEANTKRLAALEKQIASLQEQVAASQDTLGDVSTLAAGVRKNSDAIARRDKDLDRLTGLVGRLTDQQLRLSEQVARGADFGPLEKKIAELERQVQVAGTRTLEMHDAQGNVQFRQTYRPGEPIQLQSTYAARK